MSGLAWVIVGVMVFLVLMGALAIGLCKTAKGN